MKKQGFKRLTKFFAGLFASLLVIPGIVTMCVGINGTIVDNRFICIWTSCHRPASHINQGSDCG